MCQSYRHSRACFRLEFDVGLPARVMRTGSPFARCKAYAACNTALQDALRGSYLGRSRVCYDYSRRFGKELVW